MRSPEVAKELLSKKELLSNNGNHRINCQLTPMRAHLMKIYGNSPQVDFTLIKEGTIVCHMKEGARKLITVETPFDLNKIGAAIDWSMIEGNQGKPPTSATSIPAGEKRSK